MDLESILLEYGKSKNLGQLNIDTSSTCTLLINDHYLVSFEKSLDREGFFVYSSIGTIPVGKEQEISLMILKGNLFGKETGRAGIGLADQSRTLVLFEYFDESNIDYAIFLNRFNNFLQHLFYWILKLDSIDQINYSSSLTKEGSNGANNHKKIFYVR